jgi:hypothetical protein
MMTRRMWSLWTWLRHNARGLLPCFWRWTFSHYCNMGIGEPCCPHSFLQGPKMSIGFWTLYNLFTWVSLLVILCMLLGATFNMTLSWITTLNKVMNPRLCTHGYLSPWCTFVCVNGDLTNTTIFMAHPLPLVMPSKIMGL